MHLRGAKKFFTVMGFPVYVQWTFAIILAFFVFQDFGQTLEENFVSLMWIPILFGSILVHELGHAIAIKKLGYGSSKILLWGMGGVCINTRRSNSKDGMIISFAGPAAEFLLAIPAIPLLFLDLPAAVDQVVSNFVFMNIAWAVINLVPIFPLDGGKIVVHGLRKFFKMGTDASIKRAGLISIIALVPVGFVAYAMSPINLLLVLFLAQTAWQAWRHGERAVRV